MSDTKKLSQKLLTIFNNLRKLLELIPIPPTAVEKEQLYLRCIKETNTQLSEAEQEQLLSYMVEHIELGSVLTSIAADLHRPLSVPNEKYPCISGHSETIVWQAFAVLRPELLDLLDANHTGKMSEAELSDFMAEHIKIIHRQMHLKLNQRELDLVHAIIMDDIFGLGPLEQLMADPAVTDILVNGYDQIYIERNGLLRKCALSFRDNVHLLHVIRRVVAKVGRRIDTSSPYVDARLQDGSRVNAIIPPLAIDAPSLSIRRFGKRKICLDYMVRSGSMSLEMASFLSLAVRCRLNIIVSGGTGSGKTTLLNAMSWAIDVNERIVTIEDSAELRLGQPNIVRLETRKQSAEGRGRVREQDLVRNSLRMRPDRIILGEVRGAEALDMIQAMNTGHSGSMCTIHANSPDEVATRLCNMVSMSEAEHSEAVTLKQLANVLNIIVQIARMRDGKRRITEISEVTGRTKSNHLELKTIYKFEVEKSDIKTEVHGQFLQTESLPERCLKESINAGLHAEMAALFSELVE